MSLGIVGCNSVSIANFGKFFTILGDFDFLTYANVVLSPWDLQRTPRELDLSWVPIDA